MILQCFTNPDPQETKMLEKFPKHNLLHLNFLKLIYGSIKKKDPWILWSTGERKTENQNFFRIQLKRQLGIRKCMSSRIKKEYNSERLPL